MLNTIYYRSKFCPTNLSACGIFFYCKYMRNFNLHYLIRDVFWISTAKGTVMLYPENDVWTSHFIQHFIFSKNICIQSNNQWKKTTTKVLQAIMIYSLKYNDKTSILIYFTFRAHLHSSGCIFPSLGTTGHILVEPVF